jgi:hypothetical protein
MLSVREALGGAWAANFSGWVILFLPSMVLVFLANGNTPGIGFSALFFSSVAQHVAAGIVTIPLAAVIRRRHPIIPLPLGLLMWGLIGVTRGAVGAFAFAFMVGVDPLYGWRISFWVVVSLLWSPLFVYAAAQWERRVALLIEKSQREALRDEERKHSIEPAQQMHERLVSAVQKAINPVIDEITRRLEVVATGIDPAAMRRISDQLAAVSEDSAAIISGALPTNTPIPARVPLRRISMLTAAIDFENQRPLLASLLTGVILLTVAVPVALSGDQSWGALHALIATAVTTAFLVFRALNYRGLSPSMKRSRASAVFGAYATAGAFGSLSILALHFGGAPPESWLLVIVLPVATVIVASLISGTVGLSTVNAKLGEEIAAIDEERNDLAIIARVTEKRVRTDLATLMHGPVQGRLSACAMALNFHAAELEHGDPEDVESMTSAVIEHLEAASADLNSLGKSVLADGEP